MLENFQEQNNSNTTEKIDKKEAPEDTERENEQELINRVADSWFYKERIVKLKKLVSKEFLESDELRNAIKEGLKKYIKGSYNQDFGIYHLGIYQIKDMINEFSICQKILKTEEIQELIYSQFEKYANNPYELAGGNKDVDNLFQLIQDDKKEKATENAFYYSLKNSNDYSEKTKIPENIINSQQAKESAKIGIEKLIYNLYDNHRYPKIKHLQDKYSITDEELMDILDKVIVELTSRGNIEDVNKMCKHFKIDTRKKITELNQKHGIINKAKKEIIETLNRPFGVRYELIKSILKDIKILDPSNNFLYSEEVQIAIQNSILNDGSHLNINEIISVVNKCNIKKEFTNSDAGKNKILKAIGEYFESLDENNKFSIKKCSKTLYMDISLIENVIKDTINKLSLTEDKYYIISRIINYLKEKKYKLDVFITQKNAEQIVKNIISNSLDFNVQKIIEIKNTFNIDQDTMNNIVSDSLKKRISNNFFYNISEMFDYFDDSNANTQSIIENIIALLLPKDMKVALDLATTIINKYNIPKDKLKNIAREETQRLIISGNIRNASIINENFLEPQEKDQLLSKCFDIFGHNLNQEIYIGIKNLLNNSSIDPCFNDIIKHSGINGFNELKEYIISFKKEILSPNFDTKKLLDNQILKQYFKSYIRFEEGQWGEHTDEGLDKIINNNINLKENNNSITDLKSHYFESNIIKIKKIDAEKQFNYQFPDSFQNSFNKLKKSIFDTIQFIEDKKSFADIIESVKNKINIIIENLENKKQNLFEKNNSQNILKNIDANIEELKNLQLRSVANFEDNFQILSKYDEFHDELRKFVFFMSFREHKNQIEAAKDLLGANNFSIDNISWVINFAEHITHKETMTKYLRNKKSIKAFRNIIKTKSLEDELNNIQKLSTKGTTDFQFIPTRGILMELSGHIADACWASMYKLISKAFPNFTSITMVQNPNNRSERLSGSCMLIETESKDDEKLLVIRGLNPIENIINQLSIEDFCKQFIEYTKTIAKKDGRKLAIVIDHRGGASTNRPALFEYVQSHYKNPSKKVILKSASDTTFNNYNIINDCYLL